MKRTMIKPDDHMNAEDVAAALATVVLAISVALRGQGSRSTEDWLQAIGSEVSRTVASLDILPGEQPPGGQALQHMLDMINASDPRRFEAPDEERPASSMPPSAAELVCQTAKRLWPRQTAKHLANHAGVAKRSAEYWLAQRAGISADALASLLRSEAGLDFLQALMSDARPTWWRETMQARENADLRRRLDALRVEIDEARRDLSKS